MAILFAMVPLVVLGYVLDERLQWTDRVEGYFKRHAQLADWVFWSVCLSVICLSFYTIGYRNGNLTLFSNDCPFGMEFVAKRQYLDIPWTPNGITTIHSK